MNEGGNPGGGERGDWLELPPPARWLRGEEIPRAESVDGFQTTPPADIPEIPTVEPVPEPEPVPFVECWRCGHLVDARRSLCTSCRARIREDVVATPARGKPLIADADVSATMQVLGFFAAMLVVSLIHGAIEQFGMAGKEGLNAEAMRGMMFRVLVAEFIDTVLVFLAVIFITSPPANPARSLGTRFAVWIVAGPGLALALGANWLYHEFLRNLLAAPYWLNEFALKPELSTWSFLAICIQPAIVEELFFRYLLLGTLRRATGIHGAVLISSVMFGIAHIGVPLSIPMLIGLGILFGYARVWSGGLTLPILMHFVHNLVILLAEAKP